MTKQGRAYQKNLHFYANLFREKEWGTDIIHWSVFEATLLEVADYIAELERENARLNWLGDATLE